MVMALDEANQIVVDALERAGRWDDTIFVFITDNGANMVHPASGRVKCKYGSNYPLRGAKFSWWEGGIRSLGFVHSPSYIQPRMRGTVMNELFSANDWRKTLLAASGITYDDPRDDGHQQWGRISGSEASAQMERTELPLQVWLETGRFVILFRHAGALWKIMQGYPSAGKGAGTTFKELPNYSLSSIDQPFDMPRGELPGNSTSSGVGQRFMCQPYCLLNLSDDPGELVERSGTSPDALAVGKSLISRYRGQGTRVTGSRLCNPRFYALSNRDVTDRTSIDKARECGAFIPWLDRDGRILKGCH